MRRTFVYLVNHRKLDYDIVAYFVKNKLIYESLEQSKNAKQHSIIFVGFDENNVTKHGHKALIYINSKCYKSNVLGSDQSYSFNLKGSSDKLYVFEAPIDMLSYITLHKNENWKEHSYVALCGLSEKAMMKQLEVNVNIKNVILCLDNDTAGRKATDKFEKALQKQGLNVVKIVPRLKDFNEELVGNTF